MFIIPDQRLLLYNKSFKIHSNFQLKLLNLLDMADDLPDGID